MAHPCVATRWPCAGICACSQSQRTSGSAAPAGETLCGCSSRDCPRSANPLSFWRERDRYSAIQSSSSRRSLHATQRHLGSCSTLIPATKRRSHTQSAIDIRMFRYSFTSSGSALFGNIRNGFVAMSVFLVRSPILREVDFLPWHRQNQSAFFLTRLATARLPFRVFSVFFDSCYF